MCSRVSACSAVSQASRSVSSASRASVCGRRRRHFSPRSSRSRTDFSVNDTSSRQVGKPSSRAMIIRVAKLGGGGVGGGGVAGHIGPQPWQRAGGVAAQVGEQGFGHRGVGARPDPRQTGVRPVAGGASALDVRAELGPARRQPEPGLPHHPSRTCAAGAWPACGSTPGSDGSAARNDDRTSQPPSSPRSACPAGKRLVLPGALKLLLEVENPCPRTGSALARSIHTNDRLCAEQPSEGRRRRLLVDPNGSKIAPASAG